MAQSLCRAPFRTSSNLRKGANTTSEHALPWHLHHPATATMRMLSEGGTIAEAARAALGEEAFTSAWAEGQVMTPEQALAAAQHAVLAGPPPMKAAKHTRERRQQLPIPATPGNLTEREVEVLRLVARGLSDAQVAEALVISPRTVNAHLRSIYGKLGITSRHAATMFAIEHHLN